MIWILRTQGPHLTLRDARQIVPRVVDFTRGRLQQANQHAPDGALARPGFADQAQRFALANDEAHIVDRAHRMRAAAKVHAQPAHIDQCR
jgi:hypothetical protein